ncbi:hypothetical protein TWF696_004160 [Orbilia brochopaga]|uniref:Cytochrome P450 n=1 Tax=Orbilia brochopaga TaxID=3140254 RepID=A0AAV9V606_9PEZI
MLAARLLGMQIGMSDPDELESAHIVINRRHQGLVLVLLLLAGYFIGVTIYRLYLSPLSVVPGPRLAAVTGLWILYRDYKGQRTKVITELHSVYGTAIRIGPNEVSFTSTTAVKDIYTGAGREGGFPKGYLYAMFTHYGRYNMFSSLAPEEHSWRRRMITNSYSFTNVLKKEATNGDIWRNAGQYLEYVRREGHRCENRIGYAVDIYVPNIYYACDNITAHVFGDDLGTRTLRCGIDNPGEDVQLQRNSINSWYGPERRHRDYLWTNFNFALRCLKAVNEIAARISHIIQGKKDPISNYIGGTYIHHFAYTNILRLKSLKSEGLNVTHKLLIENHRSGEDNKLDDFGRASEVMDHILAGMDTTGDTLSFLLYSLALPTNHGYQDKVRDSLPKLPNFDHPLSVTTINEILNNPYMNSVIKETLLVYPAISDLLPRVVPKGGREVDGLRLPAGTLASCSVLAVNSTLTVEFNGNVDSIKWTPERWLVKSDADGIRVRELEKRLWSFGSGGRGCIGKHLALVEISLLLAAILTKFKLRQDDSSPVTAAHSHWTVGKSLRDITYMNQCKGVVRFEPLTL